MEKKDTSKLVFRQQKPDNLEGPRNVFEGAMTPVEEFFVRSHFDVPRLDAESWTVRLEGAFDEVGDYGLDELNDFEGHTIRATIECAGNSRAHLGERAAGVPWQDRAIGTAQWSGVLLREVLDDAGLADDVEEVVFVGADRGTVETHDGARLQMPYARSLPLSKARADEVLIATDMNGEPLTPDHGYPARLVVPGWYGMASVKWLSKIIAVTEGFDGYFQTEDYAIWDCSDATELMVRRRLGPMTIKSRVGSLADGDTVEAGQSVVLRGFAWGGRGDIEAVEVSVDGGESYQQAQLVESKDDYAWRRWKYGWTVPDQPGTRTICCRARTDRGEVQPDEHDWRRGAYAVNFVRGVEVNVTDGTQ